MRGDTSQVAFEQEFGVHFLVGRARSSDFGAFSAGKRPSKPPGCRGRRCRRKSGGSEPCARRDAGCRFAWRRATSCAARRGRTRMPAKLRRHAAPATFLSLAVILAFAVVALVALSGAAGRRQAAEVRRHDHRRHDPPQGPRQLPQQRHRDRRRQRHPRPERPHDRRRRDPGCRLRPPEGLLRHRGGQLRPRRGHGEARLAAPVGGGVDFGGYGTTACWTFLRQGTGALASLSSGPPEASLSSSANGLPHEGTGVLLFDSNRVRVLDNSFRDDTSHGISVIGGTRNLVGRNQIRGAGMDGINVDADARHTVLRRNRASHSKDDGFDVEGRTTKLTENRAVRNGDLGIEAVRGVIDGGGNRASGNGDGRQCVNVGCHYMVAKPSKPPGCRSRRCRRRTSRSCDGPTSC